MVDIRANSMPSDRIYVKNMQYNRDVSVNLLMDLSESTNNMIVGSNKSILTLMKEATALLAWAINKIGDNLAITGLLLIPDMMCNIIILKSLTNTLMTK